MTTRRASSRMSFIMAANRELSYKQYRQEINSLLYDLMNGTGLYSPTELFGDKWDKEDPLAQDDYNQNLLAWFGFEETLRNIGYNFETLQNYI